MVDSPRWKVRQDNFPLSPKQLYWLVGTLKDWEGQHSVEKFPYYFWSTDGDLLILFTGHSQVMVTLTSSLGFLNERDYNSQVTMEF